MADRKSSFPALDGQFIPGQRIFFTGHSFHWFLPPILEDIATCAGIRDQKILGLSYIGGSKVIQHWNAPDLKLPKIDGSYYGLDGVVKNWNDPGVKNPAREALTTSQVDVLTMSPLYLPDDGIEKFAELALEKNPNVRILIQQIWLRWETYEAAAETIPRTVDHNAITIEELWKRHAPLFKGMNDHIAALNRKFGKLVLFIVPVGQAVIVLRERILAGKAGNLKTQSQLFRDDLGHATKALRALVAYCHFAVIYRRNPVGLPLPAALANDADNKWNTEMLRALQEVAWEAATAHPQSGVATN